MTELYSAQIRYLLTIYRLGKTNTDVSTSEVAQFLQVKKASVSRMTPILMEKGLIMKRRYGKLYLTESGRQLAEQLSGQVNQLSAIICTQLAQAENIAWRAACAAVCELPHREIEDLEIKL